MTRKKDRQQEVIVVGTGPAGATAALELVKRGKRVLMIETGKEDPVGLGTLHTFTRLYYRGFLFSRSKEGVLIDRALTLGGSSAVFSGNAFRPRKSFQSRLGMDLEPEVQETIEELNLAPFPDEFMSGWEGTRRLTEAAAQHGATLVPQLKFIDQSRCNPRCDSCMQGCAINARWTARDYVKKAMAWPHGADLLVGTTVEDVLVDRGSQRAVGVRVSGNRRVPDRLYADTVVLAAGGIGTAVILQKSGIEEAGRSFFMDPMDVLVGYMKEPGPWGAMTFTHACEDFAESDGFMIGNVKGKGAWFAQMVRLRPALRSIWYARKQGLHAMGMFTKIADENRGSIDARGRASKPMTAADLEKMRKGDELCRKILIGAGCEPDSISVSRMMGGHPGGTAAIGVVVDESFETRRVKKLYVCDTSVFPQSPGSPPVLTLIAMVKQWARQLAL